MVDQFALRRCHSPAVAQSCRDHWCSHRRGNAQNASVDLKPHVDLKLPSARAEMVTPLSVAMPSADVLVSVNDELLRAFNQSRNVCRRYHLPCTCRSDISRLHAAVTGDAHHARSFTQMRRRQIRSKWTCSRALTCGYRVRCNPAETPER